MLTAPSSGAGRPASLLEQAILGMGVVMDHLKAHFAAGVREAIEAAGATLLYLPQYSPDLDPIELAFAKFKALLRKAAERSVRSLWRCIASLIPKFTPQECANYFRHASYAAT
jgi:transposase